MDSVDPIDVDLPVSPDSYVVPDCPLPYLPVEYGPNPEYGPSPEFGPSLEYGPNPEYGPLPDPSLGQLSADDSMTG